MHPISYTHPPVKLHSLETRSATPGRIPASATVVPRFGEKSGNQPSLPQRLVTWAKQQIKTLWDWLKQAFNRFLGTGPKKITVKPPTAKIPPPIKIRPPKKQEKIVIGRKFLKDPPNPKNWTITVYGWTDVEDYLTAFHELAHALVFKIVGLGVNNIIMEPKRYRSGVQVNSTMMIDADFVAGFVTPGKSPVNSEERLKDLLASIASYPAEIRISNREHTKLLKEKPNTGFYGDIEYIKELLSKQRQNGYSIGSLAENDLKPIDFDFSVGKLSPADLQRYQKTFEWPIIRQATQIGEAIFKSIPLPTTQAMVQDLMQIKNLETPEAVDAFFTKHLGSHYNWHQFDDVIYQFVDQYSVKKKGIKLTA